MAQFTSYQPAVGKGGYARMLNKQALSSTWAIMASPSSIGVRATPTRFKSVSKPRARTPNSSRGKLVTHVPTATFVDDASSAGESPVPRPTSADVAGWNNSSCNDTPLEPTPETETQRPLRLVPNAERDSFVGHPAATSPIGEPQNVKDSKVKDSQRARREFKPRPNPAPRTFPDLRPLYYVDGATGYDCVQHRPSSGLYGARVFSMRGNDSPNLVSCPSSWRDLLASEPRLIQREVTSSSVSSRRLMCDTPQNVGDNSYCQDDEGLVATGRLVLLDSAQRPSSQASVKQPRANRLQTMNQSRKGKDVQSNERPRTTASLGSIPKFARLNTTASSGILPRHNLQTRAMINEQLQRSFEHQVIFGRRPRILSPSTASIIQTMVPVDGRRASLSDRRISVSDGQLQIELVDQYRKEASEGFGSSMTRITSCVKPPSETISMQLTIPSCKPPVSHSHLNSHHPIKVVSNQGPTDVTGLRWGLLASKEMKVDPDICPFGTGRATTSISDEPYRDAVRPMRISKVLKDSVSTARKGGVFRAVAPKGSLTVRNHYLGRHVARAPRTSQRRGEDDSIENFDEEAGAVNSPLANDHPGHHFVLLNNRDADQWTCMDWSFQPPLTAVSYGNPATLFSRKPKRSRTPELASAPSPEEIQDPPDEVETIRTASRSAENPIVIVVSRSPSRVGRENSGVITLPLPSGEASADDLHKFGDEAHDIENGPDEALMGDC